MNQQEDIFESILEWSQERPLWMRDALRRVVVNASLSDGDIQELTELCKSGHGLGDGTAAPLDEKDLAITGGASKEVRLLKLTHHKGGNALAEEQSIEFGDQLTVVFGENAVGKSGYTRILKQACRSRAREDVLGNVLGTSNPLALDASILFQQTDSEPDEWKSNGTPQPSLANVSVFDSHSAPIYLRDKTDVAFRPFGLDVFDMLAVVCGKVKALLEQERSLLMTATAFPILPDGTKARKFLDLLSAFTKPEDLTALCTFSGEEQARLAQLRQLEKDSKASDPKALIQELMLKTARFDTLIEHMRRLLTAYSPESVATIKTLAEARAVARLAVDALRRNALAANLLPGTGGEQWLELWKSAEAFATASTGKGIKELLSEGERCPFCQQTIGASAADVLRHLAEYVTSTAQQEFSSADDNYINALRSILTDVNRQGLEGIIDEVTALDETVAEHVRVFIGEASRVRADIEKSQEDGRALPTSDLSVAPIQTLERVVSGVKERVKALDTQKSGMAPDATKELQELEARVSLSEHAPTILAEIERRQRVRQYDDCIVDTSTLAVTKKSTELTEKAVTKQLKQSFQDELSLLKFSHLAIEVRFAGGAKGTVYHQVVFSNAPGVPVAKVLSEGESRTLSLAAFMAELSTSSAKSAILFDDPVSSLDHRWRERIASRLVLEAKNRQVIVFTHDILFLKNLQNEAGNQGVGATYQHVIRGGQVGMTSSEVPWVAMLLKQRLGKLKVLVQDATKVFNTSGQHAYEGEAQRIYGLLREAWEQGVTEVLLNDVVERYRHSIETNKLRKVVDISEEDFKAVEDGMGQCSRWMIGHDKPATDGSPFPEPTELLADVVALEKWAKAIRDRR